MSRSTRGRNRGEYLEPAVPCGPLADELVEAVPEVAGALESFLGEWGDEPPEPGLVNLADSVILPSLEKMLREAEARDVLVRLFAFLEKMASHPDPDVRDALQVGVVNPLLSDPKHFEVARGLMGPKTLAMVDLGRSRSLRR